MLKTVSFAVMHFVVAFSVAYLLTGDLVIGGAVALVEPAVNTLGYHLHEQVWHRVQHRDRAPRPWDPGRRAAGAAQSS
jgi:uncharacterized membrane protein